MKYGEIYLVDFDKSVGHEYQGKRPALIIQSDKQLKRTNVITVMPLTSQMNNPHSDDIVILQDEENRLFSKSLIKVHQIKSFDRRRFIKRIGKSKPEILKKIKNYLKIHFEV